MNDSYTDEELEALPQTETVFDAPTIDLNNHKLRQEGYTVSDVCGTHPVVSFNIPTGTMIMKLNGGYTIVDEVTRK